MTNEERKVIELALAALEKIATVNAMDYEYQRWAKEHLVTIKEALAKPEQDQDEVDIRSRLYQRIHELETQLAQPEDKKCENCGEFGECCQDAQPEHEPVAFDVWLQECESMTMAVRHGVKFLLMPEESAVRIGTAIQNTTPPQRTTEQMRQWVGMTNDEIDQGLVRSNHALQTAGAWRDGVEWAQSQLKERNT